MKRSEVTEEMKRLMSEADRQALGLSQSVTAPGHPLSHDSQRKRDYVTRKEEQEHTTLINQLNMWELFYVHSRMDKATRNQKGIPDFVIGLLGLMICIEFKLGGRKLTVDQEEWRRKALENSRVRYYVYDNAGDAIRMLSETRSLLSGNT